MTEHNDQQLESVLETILQRTWEFWPDLASGVGLHQYDGRLPDISEASLAARAKELEQEIESLGRIDANNLSRERSLDYKLITSSLKKELFELAELEVHRNNPMEMLWHIAFSHYVQRDYAPLEQRAEALTAALDAVPSYLEDLETGLSPNLSKDVLEASVEAYQGMGSFYEQDLPKAMEGLQDAALKQRFDAARAGASKAVDRFVEILKARQEHATDEFAIGGDKYSSLLRLGEMVDLPLDRLLKVGAKDLARNRARLNQVAARIDPNRSPQEIMAEIARDHPAAESLIPTTRDMLEDIREFVVDRGIVTVPSEVRCLTTETPAFMRWAFAAMDMPGPFETRATESYYYITPVEDGWSDEQKEEWLSGFNYSALQIISIHEAYPGHYVHHQHNNAAPSKVSQVFGAYSFWEGWAHYTEEMMIEAGYGDGDPRIALGQLAEALVRDCRYVCAIRMHTDGMTVDEATRFFMDNALMEELPARKEAVRGTFDPMYLNYTLGKLMILKLREYYKAEQGSAFSLKEFHDRFLSYGAPPIPLVREMMLQQPGEVVL